MAASVKKTLQADEAPPAPLTVAFDNAEIRLDSVLRYLPGRRLVGRGQWSGQTVLFKLFAPTPRARREHHQECWRLAALAERGIAVPSLILARDTEDGALLVLEWLEGDTASVLLDRAPDDEARLALIKGLAAFVLEMHGQGCMQADVHLNNFLRKGERWHVLDAGACRVVSLLGRRRRVRNLAALLAQFPPEQRLPLEQLLSGSDIVPDLLHRQLEKARLRRYRHMLGKTTRDCTEFASIKQDGARGMVRREKRDAFTPRSLNELNRFMEDGKPLKQGNSATVVALRNPEWVVKRYNFKSLGQVFKRQLGRSRACMSWRAGYFLSFVGIRTPTPVAFVEQRRGPWVARAWLVTRYVAGEPLGQYQGMPDKAIVEEVARLFRLMLKFRISHGDMKASNFIVRDGRLWLVDLDAVRLHRTAWRTRRFLERDADRLLRNWPPESPTRTSLEKAIASVILGKGN